MMIGDKHLAEARHLYREAIEEFRSAKKKGDLLLLRDACSKGWLAAIEAAYALMTRKGVKEEELPKADRGRGYMVSKYAPREIRWLYFFLRDRLHIEGYYEGSLGFDEVESHLEDLGIFIKKVEDIGDEK